VHQVYRAAFRLCEREIALGKVAISNPACFVNEHVSNKTTTLEFACPGGTATATFAGHTFSGTIAGDVIALTNVEKFTFNNCQWESTEKISGDLAIQHVAREAAGEHPGDRDPQSDAAERASAPLLRSDFACGHSVAR
jgi:hypothetical protein